VWRDASGVSVVGLEGEAWGAAVRKMRKERK
jgi:hypothetical protein